ncbi:MAG: hypothetical protein ACI9X8_000465, partial [Pseudoalteromonas distincta]
MRYTGANFFRLVVMALKSTIMKVQLSLSDMDRHVY